MNQNNSTCENVGPWKARCAGRSLDAGNRCLDCWKAVQGCVQSLQFTSFSDFVDFHWFCWLPSLGESLGMAWIHFVVTVNLAQFKIQNVLLGHFYHFLAQFLHSKPAKCLNFQFPVVCGVFLC